MKTLNIQIDADELLKSMTSENLRDAGLMRVDSMMAQRHEELFAAIERGDRLAAFKAAEDIAWEQYGRILTGRAAA